MKKHSNSGKKSEPTAKRTKSRGPVQRDTKEVLADLVGKLKEKLDRKKVAARSAGEDWNVTPDVLANPAMPHALASAPGIELLGSAGKRLAAIKSTSQSGASAMASFSRSPSHAYAAPLG